MASASVFFPLVGLVWINWAIAPADSITFNATVSLDGSGNFTSIGAAILAAPSNSNSRFFIRVKSGTYHERVEIPKAKTFIALIGDNELTTIVVDNRSNGTGFKTSNSATLTVEGQHFMAQHLSFENSAGPKNRQAVAVLDQASYTSYYKCRFLGFQDTLYVKGSKQFFKECDIYGTVDFIFGSGLTMFQDCRIYGRLPNQTITVTAQSKDTPWSRRGFSFQNCTITSSPEIASEKKNVKVYLGRPWREYSKVVFMESFMDDVVLPEGWLEWPQVPVNHLFYGEYNNGGLGSNISRRVAWAGFHLLNRETAIQFTVDEFINATEWLPQTGVPYNRGLLSS